MLDKIPKPIVVAVVLILGVALFFLLKAPHSVCLNQLDNFKETQSGFLFPKIVKKSVRPAIFSRLIEACKIGNSPGACFELFAALRKMNRDLNVGSKECLATFGEVAEVREALTKGLELFTMLAWGSKPPELGVEKFGWMEPQDLALFCQMKFSYLKIFGEEELTKLRNLIYAKIPGEAELKDGGGICVNCESRKSAIEVFSAEEVWARSLFSFRCDRVM